MKRVIAIAGEMGCGKDTVIDILASQMPSNALGRVSSSNFLKLTLAHWGITKNRENLQLLPQLMNQGFGPDTFNEAMRLLIDQEPQDIVVYDSVRFLPTHEYLKTYFDLTLIYIDASIKTRFHRIIKRGDKHGENETSFEQFKQQHEAPTESDIPTLKRKADIIIDNNGTLEALQQQTIAFSATYFSPPS